MRINSLNKSVKALVSIPAWQQQLLTDSQNFTNTIESAEDAYSKVPLIHRGVKMRCDALSSVPIRIIKISSGERVDWVYPVDLSDLIWKTEAGLLGNGKAVILKLKNRVRVLDLQWLNPFSVSVKASSDGSLTFHQGGQSWSETDMIYIKEFSYSDDLTGGDSTVLACLNDAALMNYQTRFASRFFEAGAMPIMLVSSEGVLQEDEQKRIQNFFEKLASGVGNAWRVLATRTKLTPEVVSQDLEKMSLPELYAQATKNIANAFGIPVNMFMGDDNYASADSHRMSFWQDVIRPRGRMLEGAFNRQLLNPLGLKMEFSFDEMDIFQEDEEQRSGSLLNLVDAGMPLGDAMETLGYDLPEGREYADYNVTPEYIPGQLLEAEPVAKSEKLIDYSEELDRWQRKALKRVKEGKSADCEFESELIPEEIQDELHAALKMCIDAGEVRWVFGGEREPEDIGIYKELRRANDLLEKSLIEKPEIHVTVNTGSADEPDTKPE